MLPKIMLRRVLILIILAGGVLALVSVYYFNVRNLFSNSLPLPSENIVVVPRQALVGSGLPQRLKIPVIKIDAAIEQVGLGADGAMDVPTGPTDVAWFNLGPRPGEKGSSVIDGHFGWKNGVPSIFDNLSKLFVGDRLYVEDDEGRTITFIVRAVKTYSQTADASGVYASNDGKAHLNLITCGGVWNKIKKSYPDRLVIFSDRE